MVHLMMHNEWTEQDFADFFTGHVPTRLGSTVSLKHSMEYLRDWYGWTREDFVQFLANSREMNRLKKEAATGLEKLRQDDAEFHARWERLDARARANGFANHYEEREFLKKQGRHPSLEAQHFHTLGLPLSAAGAEITQAWRRLAQRHHPDKGGDRATFVRIQQAYERLKDMAS